jgi:hypothetical protein
MKHRSGDPKFNSELLPPCWERQPERPTDASRRVEHAARQPQQSVEKV